MMMFLAAIAAQALPGPEPASLNPDAIELFERDPVLKAWAVRTFDRNRDGWLTSYEAQPAVSTFKEMADIDRDGRVTVREFQDARSWLEARYGASAQLVSAP